MPFAPRFEEHATALNRHVHGRLRELLLTRRNEIGHRDPERAIAFGLLNHPEGRHGFDILDDDARSKQIIRRTLDFLRDHLAP